MSLSVLWEYYEPVYTSLGCREDESAKARKKDGGIGVVKPPQYPHNFTTVVPRETKMGHQQALQFRL
jgi:hypothetical protein